MILTIQLLGRCVLESWMKELGVKLLFTFLLIFLSLTVGTVDAKEYIIYSITQDFPMGNPNEVLKKNFYINMGTNQGVQKGTIIDVHRLVMRSDPYRSKQTYSHKVKIGELEVLHSETNNAIAALTLNDTMKAETPLFEIRKFMIGDKVNVNVND